MPMRFNARQLAQMGARELGNVICHTALRRGHVDVERAVAMGMIPEKDLIEGRYYWGYCRNANVAQWREGRFHYMRVKFGNMFEEDVPYPNAEEPYDVFIPILEGENGHGWEG